MLLDDSHGRADRLPQTIDITKKLDGSLNKNNNSSITLLNLF